MLMLYTVHTSVTGFTDFDACLPGICETCWDSTVSEFPFQHSRPRKDDKKKGKLGGRVLDKEALHLTACSNILIAARK